MTIDGVRYKCTEQYYQVQKAEVFGDCGAALKIMAADDPLTCKKLADLSTRTRETEKKWEAERKKVMKKANLHKFQQNAHLKAVLLSTGDMTLAEASPRDNFWGIGLSLQDKRKTNNQIWNGQNQLGQILMEIRDELRDS